MKLLLVGMGPLKGSCPLRVHELVGLKLQNMYTDGLAHFSLVQVKGERASFQSIGRYSI